MASFTKINRPRLTAQSLAEFRKGLGYSQGKLGEELARISGRAQVYTRGYIGNLENGAQEITPEFERAVRNLHTLTLAEEYTPFIEVSIQHRPGQVMIGSLYAGESRPCKWDDCENNFIPASPNQRQCPNCQQSKCKI